MGAEPPAPRSISAVERAITAIREGIRTGRYAPGQRLVEPDLMVDLGVGRNALREAFSRLRSDGYLNLEANRGASVRRMTRQDVADLYSLREALEGVGARLAGERIGTGTNREILEIATASMRQAGASADLARYMDENIRFHRTIVDLSGHLRLVELVDQLHIQTFRIQFRQILAASSPEMRDCSVDEHQAISDAIAAGDATAAEDLMRSHLRHMRTGVMALPDEDFG